MKHLVKTRNWNRRKGVKRLLDYSLYFGAVRGDDYDDGDGKYILETSNLVKAWAVWVYFMLLCPISGGWTYIVRAGHNLTGGTYNHIY